MISPPKPHPSHRRAKLERLTTLLKSHPELHSAYQEAKRVVRAFRRPAFYEITQRCNLWCEGCYYFDDQNTGIVEETSAAAWQRFFADEGARGVSMAYFVGAEPALEQDRLRFAARHFPYGNIGTNGTIRLDPEIPFRIGVSVWAGSDATDQALRGGSVFRKALRNYAGDRRAVMLYTVTRQNIDETALVAQMCQDHGLELTFNLYSPTIGFQRNLARFNGNDDRFFRISAPGRTPSLEGDDLRRVRETLDDLIDRYPGTILYSHAYNRWATSPAPRYRIAPDSGIAEDCGSRIVPPMRYYTTDLQLAQVKCCTPAVDCGQCRMYSGGWSSLFEPGLEHLADGDTLREWLDMLHVLGRIFLMPNPLAEDTGTTGNP